MTISYSTTVRNAMMDAITTAAGTGALLRFYSGTRPANPAAAITGTLLGTCTISAALAAAASGGVLTFNTITDDSAADATATCTHFRLWKSDGTTAVVDGDVGTSGSDLNLNTTTIVTGGPIHVSSFVITCGNA